jgi:hypothetical protein
MRSPARSDFFAQIAWRILRNATLASLAGLLHRNIANASPGESGTEPDDPALFQRVANFIPRLADNGNILACADVDGWLIFAANADVVKSMIAVKSGKAASLTGDAEFQRDMQRPAVRASYLESYARSVASACQIYAAESTRFNPL